MDHCPGNAPIIHFNAEPSLEQRAEMLAQLRKAFLPPPPVPVEALRLLYDTACADTGGSQAARDFLFWLAGQPDPTGFRGVGGLELRRLDRERKDAALEILRWWTGPTKTDEPLYEILAQLRWRFARAESGDDEVNP